MTQQIIGGKFIADYPDLITGALKPAAGYSLYTYLSGTVTLAATYSDAPLSASNTNPVTLDTRGEASVFLTPGIAYTLVLKSGTGATIWTRDGIIAAVSPADLAGSTGAGMLGFLYAAVYSAGTIGKWLQDLATSAGSSFIGFIQGGAGANARTVQSKLRERVSVTDFMTAEQVADSATGTPTLDATAALQAATNAMFLLGGGEVIINCVLLLKGSGGVIGGRITDGIKLESGVSYRWTGLGEVRLDPSCVIGFTTRLLAAVTSLESAPRDINFINPYITRPGSAWNAALENTALIYIGAVNRCKIINGRFVGWPGDAITLGINDNNTLSAVLETFVNDVEISGCIFDGVNKDNRQAISVLEGTNISIHHNSIYRTTRTAAPAMPGAIDIEPILASAKIRNIRIHDNTFDDIGGATGVVGFALSAALTVPAREMHVYRNTFRNITGVSDFYFIGRSAADHTAVASDSPINASFTDNVQEDSGVGVMNRRWYVGGVRGMDISRNDVGASNAQALIGYDDGGVGRYPIENLTMNGNKVRDWRIEGTIFDTPIVFFGGILGGSVKMNYFHNTGNLLAGAPQRMTVMSFATQGLRSKNIDLCNNEFVNTTTFASTSFPMYAPALDNPLTITARENTFYGMGANAFNSASSLYAQVNGDYYVGVVTIPSTTTPNVAAAAILNATTGDTFTNFVNGKDGQRITIIATGSGCTVQHNAVTIYTATAANVVVGAGKSISLVNRSGVWFQD